MKKAIAKGADNLSPAQMKLLRCILGLAMKCSTSSTHTHTHTANDIRHTCDLHVTLPNDNNVAMHE